MAQGKCVDEWRDILAEWESHGGRATTLKAVRTEFERAKSLRISRMAHQAWKLQSGKHAEWTGQWPIDNEVRESVASVIDAAATGVVAADCQRTAIFILPSLLGEEVASGRDRSPLRDLDVSAVDATRSDTTRIGQWIFFALFFRQI